MRNEEGDVAWGVVRAVPVAALRGVTWLAYRDVAGPVRKQASRMAVSAI
jgi:hypothetical protein